MKTKLVAVGMKELTGRRIASVKNGSEHMPKRGSYGAYTITTVCGRTFVCWSTMGEISVSEETKI